MASPSLFLNTQVNSVTPADSTTIVGSPVTNKWTATLSLFPQTHSDPTTTPPNEYNGTNIAVGNYFCNSATGASYLISAVASKAAGSASVTFEDVGNIIAKSDNTGSLDATPLTGAANKGFIFAVKNGLPILNGIPAILPGNLPVVFLNNIAGFFSANVFVGGSGSATIVPQDVTDVAYTEGKATSYKLGAVSYTLTYTANTVTITGGGKVRTITYDGFGNLVSDITV